MLKKNNITVVVCATFTGYLFSCLLFDEYLMYNCLEEKTIAVIYAWFIRLVNKMIYFLGGGEWIKWVGDSVTFATLIFLGLIFSGLTIMFFINLYNSYYDKK